MSVELLRLIDPEILIPSSAAKTDPNFWLRFMSWADKRELKVGPETLLALQDLTVNPPNLEEFSANDFWPVIGKLSVRLAETRSGSPAVCPRHVADSYSGKLGSSENGSILRNDLEACANGIRTTVETEVDWWNGGKKSCDTCRSARFHVLNHEEASHDNNVAHAKRLALLDNHSSGLEVLSEFASELFPKLKFSDEAWSCLRKLVGSEGELREGIISHLGVLNDHAIDIWLRYTQTHEREDALNARGVTASMESVRTRKSERYMRHRDFSFAGRKVRCEWHTKLSPLANRIHFYVETDAVLIGIVTDHLPLPG